MAETMKASEMIREALAEGVSKPADIVEWIQAKYKVEVTKSNVNQVKQKWKNDGSTTAAVPAAAKPKADTFDFPQPFVTGPIPAATAVAITIAEMQTLKTLKQKLGADGIAQALDLL